MSHFCPAHFMAWTENKGNKLKSDLYNISEFILEKYDFKWIMECSSKLLLFSSFK